MNNQAKELAELLKLSRAFRRIKQVSWEVNILEKELPIEDIDPEKYLVLKEKYKNLITEAYIAFNLFEEDTEKFRKEMEQNG